MEDRQSTICPFVEGLQPDTEQRRLHLVHPAVSASWQVDTIALRPTVLAKAPYPLSDPGIRRDDRSSVARRPEILGRIEANGCGICHGTRTTAVAAQTDRLGAVLDDGDPALAARLRDRTGFREVSV